MRELMPNVAMTKSQPSQSQTWETMKWSTLKSWEMRSMGRSSACWVCSAVRERLVNATILPSTSRHIRFTGAYRPGCTHEATEQKVKRKQRVREDEDEQTKWRGSVKWERNEKRAEAVERREAQNPIQKKEKRRLFRKVKNSDILSE